MIFIIVVVLKVRGLFFTLKAWLL